jgi:hypothetical protein
LILKISIDNQRIVFAFLIAMAQNTSNRITSHSFHPINY